MQESGENYLETILIMQNKYGFVRAIDIANELGYTKPSISRAMSILKKDEYINIAHSGNITLTKTGLALANSIYERHKYLSRFLIKTLGLDPKTADNDACRIEHIISQKAMDKIKEYVDKSC
ncbi:MAG: metal-dependent transcriptional regulator [Clostridia bacterium]|jgi:Mn-dependent DtxR family transcriptional regulator|nr:metal-dependent transcriptional regulator [Clostridia bacterium]